MATDAKPVEVSTTVVRIRDELTAMIEFASGQGVVVPPRLAGEVCRLVASCDNAEELWKAHAALAKLVAPATPRALLVMKTEAPRSWGTIFGPVRLIRQLMAFALIMLVAFLVILSVGGDALTSIATTDPSDLLAGDRSVGAKVVVALSLVTSAGLGASFAALYRAGRFVGRGVFDPRYEASYWINIVLGLIAGFTLAELLPSRFEGLGQFGKPLLALLGGFSATAVHRILTRLVQAVESLVQQDADEMIAQREREIREEALNDALRARIDLAAKVIKFKDELASRGVNDETVQSLTNDMLDDLVPPQPA